MSKAEREVLRLNGFEPWGKDAWVRFAGAELGGTVYDDSEALQEAYSNPEAPNGC